MKIRELLYFELCRRDFHEYCKYMSPKFYTDGKQYLRQICDAFQAVSEKKIRKLAISLPPRAGKSLTASLWCSWELGRHPNGSIMRNSYAAKLAEKFSRDIRDGMINERKFQTIFPDVKMSKNLSAIDGWALEGNTQPSYFCAGVGGPITGFGCTLAGILDDPIKNIEQALSETYLETLWNWYTSTHLSRFETRCPEIHIATRWTKKDVIGQLTDPESEFYDPEFVTIVVPALNEEGNSFCEEIKTTQEYYEIKKVTDDFIWEAEFMQNPVEEKGLLFPSSQLKRFGIAELCSKEPDGVVGYTDTADKGTDYLSAISSKRYGDYTYITDVVFTQEGVEITEPLVAQMMLDTKCKRMTVESNNGGESFGKNVKKIIAAKAKELKAHWSDESKAKGAELDGYYVDFQQTTQNKETRILMSAGYVKEYFYFRNDYEPGSDYDKFMRQLTSYIKLGKNVHDDAADSVTGLAEYMQNHFHLKKPKVEIQKGFYLESELLDMVAAKKITKYQMKQYLEKGIRSW